MAGKRKDDYKVFTLHVEGLGIESLNLDEIGEVLIDFAQILGRDAQPKFHSITKGSIKLAAKVRTECELEVKTRTFLVRTGDGPEDAVRAEQRISRRLGIHRARRATVLDSTNAKVLDIPIEKPASAEALIPALTKFGALQGQIIRIGGKQEVVPVDIQDVDGVVYPCRARRDLARRLAREIFGPTIRVQGSGKWRRDNGVWRVEDFHIREFEVLEDQPLNEVIADLRKVRSSWQDREDPHGELEQIRRGEEK